MSIETMRELQAYGYFALLVFMVIVLYSYWFHLKRSEKTGRRNYEKYGKLALDDAISDEFVESSSSDDANRSKK